MSKHPHAELMAQYAQDALETDSPWERWQYKWMPNNPWQDCESQPMWHLDYEYRRKPKAQGVYDHVGKTEPTEPQQIMCELAGVKFPMPAQKRLKLGQKYYVPEVCCPELPDRNVWDNWSVDEEFLKGNLVQLTEDGAALQGRAVAVALKQAIEKAKEQMK